ncbi:MAG: SDR family oxidoreductase [Sphingomonadales bacterium]|jgi:nucleoside-diphosphate-sugar epimerase
MSSPSRLFIFGLGYTGLMTARHFKARGYHVSGTVRSIEKARQIEAKHDIPVFTFDDNRPLKSKADLLDADYILSTVPPVRDEMDYPDAVLRHHLEDFKHPNHPPKWIGYLSSTGVYGDTQGEWVDENAPLLGNRVPGRVIADRGWQEAFALEDLPVHIFRLPGIYGPGRSTLERAAEGRAARIAAPGHVFSRIHVEDIISALELSIAKPNPGAIYNIADNEPSSAADVSAYAHKLLGMDPPPLTPLEHAGLSPIGKSFYQECRRVKNDKAKHDIGWSPKYPSYKEGLQACLKCFSEDKRSTFT